jgi:hypothetical protein
MRSLRSAVIFAGRYAGCFRVQVSESAQWAAGPFELERHRDPLLLVGPGCYSPAASNATIAAAGAEDRTAACTAGWNRHALTECHRLWSPCTAGFSAQRSTRTLRSPPDSNVTVHYFRNLTTNKDVEFKFP